MLVLLVVVVVREWKSWSGGKIGLDPLSPRHTRLQCILGKLPQNWNFPTPPGKLGTELVSFSGQSNQFPIVFFRNECLSINLTQFSFKIEENSYQLSTLNFQDFTEWSFCSLISGGNEIFAFICSPAVTFRERMDFLPKNLSSIEDQITLTPCLSSFRKKNCFWFSKQLLNLLGINFFILSIETESVDEIISPKLILNLRITLITYSIVSYSFLIKFSFNSLKSLFRIIFEYYYLK